MRIKEIAPIPKEGITEPRTVIVYFNGKFPKKAYPIKDTTLPTRLFPNATEFIIRCDLTDENKKYFRTYYPKKNTKGEDIRLRFLSPNFSDWECASYHSDALYCPWCGFDGYQKSLSDFKRRYHEMMLQYSQPIWMFINEPSCSSIKSYISYLEENIFRKKDNINFLKSVYSSEIKPYSNVRFMPNDTPFKKASKKPWWESKVLPISQNHDITVTPIPDNIIYDLPSSDELIDKFRFKNYDNKRGIWLGTCFDSRTTRFNNLFVTPELLKFDILGRGTEDVNLYSRKDSDTNIDNSELPEIFAQHEWSIYISRGKFTNMLGATFYEPLLNGLPQFVDEKCDPEHEIFPGVKCYFSTENELKKLIEGTDIFGLWCVQVKHLL